MRRLFRVVLVSALVLASLTISLRAASATTPGGFVAASSTCSGGTGYPVKAGATLSVSTTTPYSGQTIDVSGSNFQAGENVTIKLNGKAVATVKADSKGSFRTSFKVTGPPGKFVLTATGTVCGVAGLLLTVRAGSGVGGVSASQSPGAGAGGAATGQGGGGLAFTGVDVALLLLVAVALLGGGGFMLRAGRRRHAARG
ncbi:MAG TPA: hypothetical protein VFT67_06045 [Jatrophihabitantaceae bacterium]|jgi:hypothetical protein|nr:hypothetical protein [Jatrophihabitantaceae bacterium]